MKGKGTIIYFWLNAQQLLNRDFHRVRVRLGLASFTWAMAIVCCCLLSLFSQAARGDSVTGSNTGDVTISDAGGYVSSTITISSTLADLVPQSISVPSSATAGASVTVSYTVANTGGTAAPASHTKVQIKNASNVLLIQQTFSTSAIGANSSVNESRSMSLAGASAGTYYAYVIVDNNSEVTQSNTANDLSSGTSFTVQSSVTLADLVPQSISVSSPATAGASVTVSYTIANTGGTAAPASHTKVQIKNASAVLLTEQTFSTSAIGANSSVSESRSMSLSGASAGTYYAYVIVDNNSEVTQSNTANDLSSGTSFTVSNPTTPITTPSPTPTPKTSPTPTPTATPTATPKATPTVTTITPKIAAGGYHSFAWKSGSTVWVWGYNEYGQLGDSSYTNKSTPVKASGLGDISDAAGGCFHSIALKSDGTVYVWGRNNWGQFGDGSNTDRNTPSQLSGLTDVTSIAAGYYDSMFLKSDGTVWTCGGNYRGQLGDGTTTDKNSLAQVSGLNNVTAIAAGRYHSMALKSDGTVWTWGDNTFGQLGDGTTNMKTTPVQVNGLTDVIAIAVGEHYSMALKSDGTVRTWGYNGDSQLGDGTNTNRSSPVQVNGLSGVTAIAAGEDHGTTLKSDGTVWVWGYNNYGQLGDGTYTNKSTPIQVSDLDSVNAISCGYSHSMAMKSDGTVWAWGRNDSGQLGDGTTTDRKTPVQVKDINVVASVTPTPTPASSPTPTPTQSTCTDSYEPNDSSSTAYGPLSSGSSYSGKICSDSDVDWFKVNITTTGTISINLTVPSSYDHDLELYDPSYAWIAGSYSSNTSESISKNITTTGIYYIRISGSNGSYSATNSYTLTYTFTSTTSATPTPLPTPKVTPTPTATPTRILLLLHGFGSNPKTWKEFVKDRYGSYSILDYEEGDVINTEPVLDKKGILCYAVKFGAWDTSSGRKNVEGETATESSSGDYSTFEQMGREVQYAIEAILNKYSQTNVEIVLLGHSRGGLVARKYLQDLATSKEKAHIVGLLTTSTPHKGTPIGRIYSYLSEHSRDSCEYISCERDWNVIDSLKAWYLKIFNTGIDGRCPTVDDFSVDSDAINDLNSNISQLPSNIVYGEISNSGTNLGVVKKKYSLLESSKSFGLRNKVLLSKNARNYILCDNETNCNNKPKDFPGDGLVPVDNQDMLSIDGFPSSAKISSETYSKVLHVEATSQEKHISKALEQMLSKW